MWLNAPNISCKHGFSTRLGGVSLAPFDSLNLGGSEDNPENILRNRQTALQALGLDYTNLAYLKQIHSAEVCLAKIGQQQGDALVSNSPGIVLAVSIADCYPILFYDEKNNVIGAAHAGWRGTVNRIAQNTIHRMVELGAEVKHIQVAIGQGISMKNFEVGPEVIAQFKSAGFRETCWKENKIDLVACNKQVLLENSIPEKNTWSMNRCTYESGFFSYRRDKGLTGRMWGMIAL